MRSRRGGPHIVLVCEAAGGGVGKHVLDVAERLPSHGFQVLVVHSVLRAEADFVCRLASHARHGYHIARVDVPRAPGPRDMLAVMQLRRAMHEFGGADILHGHSAKGGALARLARWGCARRVFYTPHAFYAQAPSLSPTARRFYGAAEHALSLATDQVIATSREEMELARALGIPARKLAVVENGIPLRADDDLATARHAAREALGFAAQDRVVGFVARLVAQKAPLLAIETFHRIREAHPDTRFVLLGDGPETDAVAAAIAEHGLSDDVRWLRQGIGRDVLPAVDVLLVTSHYEGFSYVMLEGLDAGCAIVTTSVGGARDCVVDARNGAIVQPATPDSLARSAGYFLESADRLCVARAVSRERARDFDIDRMIDRLVSLYHGAIHDAA